MNNTSKEQMLLDLERIIYMKNDPIYFNRKVCFDILSRIETFLFENELGISSEAFGDKIRGFLNFNELIEFRNYLREDVKKEVEVIF